MTDQKTFKQRVRERMARTGESYTTARRHLLPDAAPAGDDDAASASLADTWTGLLPGVERTGGIHGDTAVFVNAFEQAGVRAPHDDKPYSEAMLFGLSGGIGFMYFVFEYKGRAPTLSFVARNWSLPDELTENIVQRTGVQVTERTTGSPNVARQALDDALVRKRVAICAVDPVGLPYLSLPGMWAGNDARLVGVVGIDREMAWLDDRCLKPNGITLDDLAEARASHKKSKQRMVSIDAAPEQHDLAAAIREAVGATALSFREPRIKSYAGNFGFAGLEKWRDLLTDDKLAKGWRQLFATPAHTFTALKRTYECARYHVTPPAGGRPLYADFLEEAAPIVGDETLAQAAGLFRRSAVLWDEIADLALPEDDPVLGRARELIEDLHDTLRDQGSRAALEIAELRADLAELPGQANLGEDAAFAIFDALAERVGGVLELEREAFDLLG